MLIGAELVGLSLKESELEVKRDIATGEKDLGGGEGNYVWQIADYIKSDLKQALKHQNDTGIMEAWSGIQTQ
ncbi:hypothetical protein scyTo_0017145, partial [Scyliorhinus torazame]|nr:hypothetical protein [Scyliorhinus torazame]